VGQSGYSEKPVKSLQAETQKCRGDLLTTVKFADGDADENVFLRGTRVDLIGEDFFGSKAVDSMGKLDFKGLLPGQYEVRIITPDGLEVDSASFVNPNNRRTTDHKKTRQFEILITEPEASTLNVDILPKNAHMECFAYVDLNCACDEAPGSGCEKSPRGESDKHNEKQQPIDGITITLIRQDRGQKTYCGPTANGGKLSFDVAPGLYTVSPSLTARGKHDCCNYHLACSSPLFVQLSPGQSCCTLDVRYCLDEATIYVSPAIECPREHDLASSSSSEFMLFRERDPQFFRKSSCEKGLHAAFSGLAPGTYILALNSPFLALDGKTYQLQSPPCGAVRVVVCSGQYIDLSRTFRFVEVQEDKRATDISGQITDSTGQPVVHQLVELVQAKTDHVLWTAATDGAGNYGVLWRHKDRFPEVELRTGRTRAQIPYRLPSFRATSNALAAFEDPIMIES